MMGGRVFRCMGVLLVLAACAFATRPQVQEPVKEAPPRPSKEPAQILHIEAEEATHNDATGLGRASKVTVTVDDTIMRADIFTWNEKTKTGEATGNLSLNDPQADATGDKILLSYARSKRLLVLSGNVQIILKPKKEAPAHTGPNGGQAASSAGPAPVRVENGKARVETEPGVESHTGEARKYPITVTCDKLEYQYAKDKKHAKLTGNFKAVQKLKEKTRTLTAAWAEWFGLEDRVVLHPPVHMEDTKGLKADTKEPVTLFTKEGAESIRLQKSVITMPTEEEEEEPAKAAPSK
jgi:lipopolysaccharide export system protein LptA